ncbi:uncharacterized protein I303_103952 [Kwoniella dejecticola CBS 10117]|uniref:Cytochrome c oxidase assembly protein n=1 Tax=Kwoniella dejecticola CBS 10117 TaxID=1296121 RepID=A0A1A6A858_9TREE|nr:uncharacterized protein I303_03969 [Kwoniella dejecticola CBS 10117]OBR86249.1 hypothetical protein I303_03969 [Kwoniella dejecticola CBS 10117]
MSRASKIFLASSFILSGVTVWGVHFIQRRESETMYQGVIKDEARIAAKKAAAALLPAALTPQSISDEVPLKAHSSGTPLNTPSSSVQQPAPVIDPECQTCVISPPPQLLEAQSKEQRAKERDLRMKEYEDQKKLEGRLRGEQGVHEPKVGSRLA